MSDLLSKYDIDIIRPQLKAEDFKFRAKGIDRKKLNNIIKHLKTLHTLETMASTIYRFQISRKEDELNRQLISAMCNEMTHQQDFAVKLYEYGTRPFIMRFCFYIVGMIIGLVSKSLGTAAILKTGIWVETKAVSHYKHILEDIDADKETTEIIEKDAADEFGHINRWKAMISR